MKRKLVCSLALAAIMTASLFTGCASSDNKEGADTSTETTSTEAEAEEKGEPMPISWVGWTTPTDDEGTIVKMLEEKFNVDFTMIDKSDGSVFDVKLASGEIPDVFQAGYAKYRKFMEDEIIAEIPQEKIQQFAPNLYAAYQAESSKYLDWTKLDGKNYGLLVPNPESGDFRPLIAWRGDWLEKVGITKVPETLAEMEEALYKFKNDDPDGNGANDTYGMSASMFNAVYGAYGYIPHFWTRKDDKLVYGAVQPEMKEALAVVAKWYKDGLIEPEFAKDENKGVGDWSVSTVFATGLIGVSCFPEYLYWEPKGVVGGRTGSNVVELGKNFPGAEDKIQYGKPPVGPTGKRGLTMRNGLQGAHIVFGFPVGKDEAKMQKILEIFDYATVDFEGFLLTRFGVEGTHYKMQDNMPVPIEPYTGWAEIVKEGGGATFNNAIWLPSIIEKVNAEYKWGNSLTELRQDGYYNEVAIPLPSQAKLGTETDKIREEAYISIITGAQPIEYFDQFVKDWEAAGGATLTEEAQSQF